MPFSLQEKSSFFLVFQAVWISEVRLVCLERSWPVWCLTLADGSTGSSAEPGTNVHLKLLGSFQHLLNVWTTLLKQLKNGPLSLSLSLTVFLSHLLIFFISFFWKYSFYFSFSQFFSFSLSDTHTLSLQGGLRDADSIVLCEMTLAP